ncbi:hypothetical protein FQ377_06320 [Arthrobacter echini]|uniref:Tetratricopeptide repeat protein n=1 Tax=Arthrobacter echini TaxID=1529066 RepID=A0A5D0XSS9_9MICC|nr:hypothetical protein [Arthrobacter echini]TYC99562.1 hypothetical protein FQ377_06320 [Arthrobacter echini]
MTEQKPPEQRLMLELQTRSAWNERNYEQAQAFAMEMADCAAIEEDSIGYWNATFIVAECLRKQGRMDESKAFADDLAVHPLTSQSTALSARVSTLAAFALQGRGDLDLAIEAAKSAVQDSTAEPNEPSIRIEAQNALIAALAESGRLEAAWQQSRSLAELLSSNPESPYAGQSYWAIGNVAFLLQRTDDGIDYHRWAAKTLSPTNDLDLWARFNHGSAQVRLAAGVVEPETLECIERAELASSIVGGTERDHEELKLTRAHWLVLTGQFEASADLLRSVVANKDLVASHTAAQAHFLLGQALSGLGNKAGATANLELSEELFLQSGAEDRATAARELIESLRRRE